MSFERADGWHDCRICDYGITCDKHHDKALADAYARGVRAALESLPCRDFGAGASCAAIKHPKCDRCRALAELEGR